MNPHYRIVDRDAETELLFKDINTRTNFVINILHAPTAIGKSSITIKLSQQLHDNNIECITVRTNPINTTYLSEWTFVNWLFDEINSAYSDKNYSFENFINSNEYFLNLKTKKDLDILKDLNKDNFLFKPFFMQHMNAVSSVFDILLENEKIFLYAKQEYINYVFSMTDIILIIDNLQIIDNNSLDFLRRSFHFNSPKKHYIIFEYTENRTSYDGVLKLIEYFKYDNIIVKSTPIKKTDPCYIADIIDQSIESKPTDYKFNCDLISHYIELDTGNIRELIDFSLNYTLPEKICNDKTIESILMLDEIELFILFVLMEFDGNIELECMTKLLIHAKINDNKKIYKRLLSKRLIKLTYNCHITFEHASITDALNFENKKLIIARNSTINTIKSYVETLLSEQNEISYPFLKAILNIYKKQSPLEIYKLLQYIEKSILVNLQPCEAWGYISAFINATIDKVDNFFPLYLNIFNLLFKFELYKEGFSCLEKAYSYFNVTEKPIVMIYRMLYLAALDKHDENIAYFQSVYNSLLGNDRLYLIANLAVLSSYRSLGDNKSCMMIHRILKKRKYKKYVEYGYRNRIVDMYLSRKKSIKYLKKSIKFFEEKGQTEQLAKTLITYTHVLGGLGKTILARKQITKAEILLEGKILGKHMIFVNQAVLNLVEGNFGVETFRLLDMAETSAIVPFDKLAIIVNKLVWCYENNRFDLVHFLNEKAEQLLLLEPDKHVHSLLYYNLYLNYSKEGDGCKGNFYLNKAKQTMQYCEPVKSRILNKPTNETKFILRKPWHICYLTYWTFDVLSDDITSS